MNDFNNLGVVLKLVSGETIICQVMSDTEKTMLVRDPYLINIISEKHSNGVRATTYYSDWFLGVSSRVHLLRKEHVLSAAIPDLAVKKDYATLIAVRDESDQNKQNTSAKDSSNWKDDLNYKIDDPDIPGRN